MSMSKRDYEMIASELYEAQKGANFTQKVALTFAVRALANRFAANNPRFDAVKFLTAAGMSRAGAERYRMITAPDGPPVVEPRA